jgi:BioD-like phosphotransacetylase family protein
MYPIESIYVAATSQHVGKTTTTLGLVSAFMNLGYKVGYCKPVGQKYLDVQDLRVDKDTLLFADLIHFDLDPTVHSPIILGKGATQKLLDNPNKYDLDAKIMEAADALRAQNEVVIYEGTGHPGVGSIANLSNARVAKMVKAGVVMIVPGGIGSTIDMLNMCMALFREQDVPIIGVIINKVVPEKQDKVKKYVKKWLDKEGLALLGTMPYDKTLAYPVMKTVADSINGVVTHNQDMLGNKVEDILAGSLIDLKELKSFNDLLLVASVRSLDSALKKIHSISKMINEEGSPLAGIVATGDGTPGRQSLDYIKNHRIPLVRTNLDTYGSVIKISRIEVKINRTTPWKVNRAIELIGANVDVERIASHLHLENI